MKIISNERHKAIYSDSENGPTFGCDIIIFDQSNTTICYSYVGCYSHPQYAHNTDEANTFLAGSYGFQLDEIEVYEKE